MKKYFLAGGLTALVFAMLAGASYGVFSPGGDLTGTWNSQTVVTVNGQARTDDGTLVSNGTVWERKALPDCDDTGGNHLNYDTSTNAYSCGTSGSGVSQTVTTPTLTVTGFSDTTTYQPTIVKTGRIVTIHFGITGTSNATTFTIGTIDVSLRPSLNHVVPVIVRNNGTDVFGSALIATTGTITFYAGVTGTAFTSSGQKQCASCVVTFISAS